jgi:nitric oxide reductase subunit B
VDRSLEVLWTSEDVLEGQQIWQSIGGQQVGSVWGHGALQAPDWSADWLHREAEMSLEGADAEATAAYIESVRRNAYVPETNEVVIGQDRAKVLRRLTRFYVAMFTGATSSPEVEDLPRLRKLFQVKDVALYSEEKAEKLAGFVFWSAWACVTQRPGASHSYTNNWPQERLVGNSVSPEVLVWSLASVALLIFGIGFLAWVRSVHHGEQGQLPPPREDPLRDLVVTPSMASMVKWVYVVFFLSGFQICLGVYTVHLTVEGNMGFPNWLTQHITYTVARTWHTQSAVYAIATSFLATGLFLAPAIGGRKEDPPLQRPLCDFLFLCLLVIVGGSMAGQVAAITQSFESLLMSQFFGHQGYEYVELGRFYQYFLLVGLMLWLLLVLHGIHPALSTSNLSTATGRGQWHLVVIITCAAVLISFFWASGLMYDARSNLAVMDYWRFWIVHMWVEGIFEIFITVVVAQVFVMLGVLDPSAAAGVTLFTSGVFLFGGIPGMYHHNYFAGTPSMIMAVGSCFSCLEVCPLALMGMEASEYIALEKAAKRPESKWLMNYKPIIDCFIYVAFWNLVGAGFLGFIINPPVSQYYMIGGYLTLSHSHGALWGVYGVLAMALSLLVLRLSDTRAVWDTAWLDWGLKLMNLGMFLQIFASIFPIGIYQFWLSVAHDYWYARSEHFHGDPAVQWMKLGRSLGDSIFAFAMLMVLWFVFKDFLRRASSARQAALQQPLLA